MFSFTIIITPRCSDPDRRTIFGALADTDVRFLIIDVSDFLRHDVLRFCESVGGVRPKADFVGDFGFVVGDHTHDFTSELAHLGDVLDRRWLPPAKEQRTHVGAV